MTAAPESRPGREEAVAFRRTVNDEIAEIARRIGADAHLELKFVCECGDLRCDEIVTFRAAQYEQSAAGSVVAHA
jgi:hypothetical protein